MATLSTMRGLGKEEKCGKGDDCDGVAELAEEEEVQADEVAKCKGKECDDEYEEEEVEELPVEEHSASEDADTLLEEEADDLDTSAGTAIDVDAATETTAVAVEENSSAPVIEGPTIEQEEEEEDTTNTPPFTPDEKAIVETLIEQPQQPEEEEEVITFEEVEEGEDVITETEPTTLIEKEEEEEQEATSPVDEGDDTKATILDGDGFPGPTDTGTSSTATSLTIGESGKSVASLSSESGGLQPVGKALLSVALSGAFAAILAVLLVRRRRRKSDSGALTIYSPSKDDSYFVDRDKSMEDTASSSGSPDKTSRQLVLFGTEDTTAIEHIESGSQEGFECSDLADVDPTAAKPYGPENPPVDEQPASLKLCGTSASPIVSSLPRQISSPSKSKSSAGAIVSRTPNDKTIISSPQLSPDAELEVYEDVTYPEDEANTIRAIVRKYQVENVSTHY